MAIAPQRSSNRVHLYTLVHTLHETTGTTGTPIAMLTIDRSTARHLLAKARLLPSDCQSGLLVADLYRDPPNEWFRCVTERAREPMVRDEIHWTR